MSLLGCHGIDRDPGREAVMVQVPHHPREALAQRAAGLLDRFTDAAAPHAILLIFALMLVAVVERM